MILRDRLGARCSKYWPFSTAQLSIEPDNTKFSQSEFCRPTEFLVLTHIDCYNCKNNCKNNLVLVHEITVGGTFRSYYLQLHI